LSSFVTVIKIGTKTCQKTEPKTVFFSAQPDRNQLTAENMKP